VPGSKSCTHRITIAAALSDGQCEIRNALKSEDTLLTLTALKQMGIETEFYNEGLSVTGNNKFLEPSEMPIFLGNSGTSMRFIAALAAIGHGRYTLIGTNRMHLRPIQDLLDGLRQISVKAVSLENNGCPPVEIHGGTTCGGKLSLNCSLSSQFLSALLLIAPILKKGLDIRVSHGPVSKPYIDMTLNVMDRFGIEVMREGYQRFIVSGRQTYRSGMYAVEPDASQAGYFWAAAAISGAVIKVKGIRKDSAQGDVRFTKLLLKMGCRLRYEHDGITVTGPKKLKAIHVDMSDMPDMVPTLAVVAAFAQGRTVIENVAHLKEKESDRLSSVVNELNKMGIEANCSQNRMMITGGVPRGAKIETYQDHRIAMSFALSGLKVPGVKISGEECVNKSFPNYWDVLDQL